MEYELVLRVDPGLEACRELVVGEKGETNRVP